MNQEHNALPAIGWENGSSLPNQDPQALRDLTKLFVDRLRQEKILLAQLYDKQDWKMLAEEAHRIFGCSCYFGVPAICKALEHLERSATNENPQAIELAYNAFCHEYERLIDAADQL